MTASDTSQKAVYECSPSQVSTYEDCPRKWAFSWLDGLEGPKHPSAIRGIKVHRHLELWLKKRVPPGGNEEARVAQVMLPHLPPPHLVRQEHVEMPAGLLIGDVRFVMVLDLFVPSLSVPVPVVHDHKTTSSFDWALTPDVMHEDVQASLYAAWAMVATKCGEVDVQWTYGLTKGAPRAHPVRARLTLPMIQDRLRRSVESAREMREILEAGGSAIDVPYDASACEKYGGCPFQDRCNLTPQDRMESIMSQGTAKEDFLRKLREGKGKSNGAPASPGQVNPPAVAEAAPAAAAAVAPAAPAAGNKLAARIAARAAAPAAAVAEPPPPPPPATEPEPEAAAAEEAPRRTRGRPAGSTAQKADPRSEIWTGFAGIASAQLLGGMELGDQIDADAQDGVAQAASSFADKMLGEYLTRFGG